MQSRWLRRLLQFRLRTLFVVLSIGCLWLGWNVSVVNERREMLSDITARGGQTIYWGQDADILTFPEPDASAIFPPSVDYAGPISWLRRLLGDRAIIVLYLPSSEFYADDAERIQEVFPETLLLPGPFGMQASWISDLREADF